MSLSPQGLRTLWRRSLLSIGVGWGVLAGLAIAGHPTVAQTTDADTGDLPPEEAMFQQLLNLPTSYGDDLAFADEISEDWPLVTPESASLYYPTLPNVWWTRDQLPTLWRVSDSTTVRVAGYRLIRDWTAFHSNSADAAIIDVQVDPQYWNRFNYFQQFAVLRQLGTTGMYYGYHVRIYNSIDLAGIHACDFTGVPSITDSPAGEIPIPELKSVNCSAAIGSFVNFADPDFGDDLFAPP